MDSMLVPLHELQLARAHVPGGLVVYLGVERHPLATDEALLGDPEDGRDGVTGAAHVTKGLAVGHVTSNLKKERNCVA